MQEPTEKQPLLRTAYLQCTKWMAIETDNKIHFCGRNMHSCSKAFPPWPQCLQRVEGSPPTIINLTTWVTEAPNNKQYCCCSSLKRVGPLPPLRSRSSPPLVHTTDNQKRRVERPGSEADNLCTFSCGIAWELLVNVCTRKWTQQLWKRKERDVRNDLCSPLNYIMYSQPWSWAAVHVPLIERWQYLWFPSSFGTHPECSSAFQSRRPLESLWGFTFTHSHLTELDMLTRFVKRDHFEMHVLQMCIFLQWYRLSKCGCLLEEVLLQQWCENEAFGWRLVFVLWIIAEICNFVVRFANPVDDDIISHQRYTFSAHT